MTLLNSSILNPLSVVKVDLKPQAIEDTKSTWNPSLTNEKLIKPNES